jgi:hypothetical protein
MHPTAKLSPDAHTIEWTLGDRVLGFHAPGLSSQSGWIPRDDRDTLSRLQALLDRRPIVLYPRYTALEPVGPGTVHATHLFVGGFSTTTYHELLRPGRSRLLPWSSGDGPEPKRPSFQGPRCEPLLCTDDLGVVVLTGRDQELLILDRSGKLRPLPVHQRPRQRMDLSADGRFVVTAHRDRTVRVFDVRTASLAETHELPGAIRAIRIEDGIRIELLDGEIVHRPCPDLPAARVPSLQPPEPS